MRIVHLTNAYAPGSGGVRTMVQALGRGYRERGHELVLVVPGARASDDEYEWGRLTCLPGAPVPGSGGYRVMLNPARVRALLDRIRPDGLEVSDRLTLRSLGSWARRADVPSLVIAHERLDGVLRAHLRLPPGASRALADHHNRGTVDRFDHVVATTRFAGEEFNRIGARTVQVPLGVDLENFRLVDGQPDQARDHARLVLCSRLSREKRPDLAVDTLKVLLARGCRARLVVAGDGPMAAGLRRRCSALPVTFLGHVGSRAAVARLLAGADVVLAPGPIETFGLSALEALACGSPVVAAATSAVAELVEPAGGHSASPQPEALADAVLRVLAEPRTARRAAARTRAEQFPWSRTVDSMLALHGEPARVGAFG